MPLNWYLALVLVAGCIALGNQLVHLRWSRGGFLLALAVALAGAALGGAFGSGLRLPELLPMKVQGQDFPAFWALFGGVVFVFSLDVVLGRRRRRRVRA